MDTAEYSYPAAEGKCFRCPDGRLMKLLKTIGVGAFSTVFSCVVVSDSENSGSYDTNAFSQQGSQESSTEGTPKGTPENTPKGTPKDTPIFAAKVLNFRKHKLISSFPHEKLKLMREIEVMVSLQHHQVIDLFAVIDTNQDEVILLMEYASGGELFEIVAEQTDGANFSEDAIRYVSLQILEAMQYMRNQGVIHRDLKLENILVTKKLANNYLHAKVADFGLSRLVRSGSAAKSYVGTPQYQAPEILQAAQKAWQSNCGGAPRYGQEADVWSLGCMLYVMAAGRYPFQETVTNGLEHEILFASPDMQSIRQNYSAEFARLVETLLAKDPSTRPTVHEIQTSSWLRQPLAKDAPPLPRLGPKPRRPIAVAAGALLLAAATETAQREETKREERDARDERDERAERDERDERDERKERKERKERENRNSKTCTAIVAQKAAQKGGHTDEPSRGSTGSDDSAQSSGSGSNNTSDERKDESHSEQAPPFWVELASLQLSAIGILDSLELALRRNQVRAPARTESGSAAPVLTPETVLDLKTQVSALSAESMKTLRLFIASCGTVLRALEDVLLAVDIRDWDAASEIFEDVRDPALKTKDAAECMARKYQEIHNVLETFISSVSLAKLDSDVGLSRQTQAIEQQLAAARKRDAASCCQQICSPATQPDGDLFLDNLFDALLLPVSQFQGQRPAAADVMGDALETPTSSTRSTRDTDPPTPSLSRSGCLGYGTVCEAVSDASCVTSAVTSGLRQVASMGTNSHGLPMPPKALGETSALLILAADKLRRVEMLMAASGEFWDGVELAVQQAASMRSQTARLASYVSRNEGFLPRLKLRLSQFETFWQAQRGVCLEYLSEMEVRQKRFREFLTARRLRAELVETTLALTAS